MPCNSDYLAPTGKEQQLQETAQLLVWLRRRLQLPFSRAMKRAADDIYCKSDYVPDLCALITSLTAKQREELVYDAHSADSRRLATWWEAHKAADKKRKLNEAADKKRQKLKKAALDKLTPAERRALGV